MTSKTYTEDRPTGDDFLSLLYEICTMGFSGVTRKDFLQLAHTLSKETTLFNSAQFIIDVKAENPWL